MQVARFTNRTRHCRAALAAVLVACFATYAQGQTTTPALVLSEVTLLLEPLKATVKEGEEIGVKLTFVGAAQETTLILPMGADATGIITFRAIEVASGREWTGSKRDPRSFAADSHQRLPAGAKLEQHHHALRFEGPDTIYTGNLPAGTYRIVVTYDEGRTFRPEHRTSRMVRSEPVEIVVSAR